MARQYHSSIPIKAAQQACKQRGVQKVSSTLCNGFGHSSADIISEMTFSKRTGFLEAGEDGNIINRVRRGLHLGYKQDLFVHFDGTHTHSLAVLLNANLMQDDIQRSTFYVVQPTWL